MMFKGLKNIPHKGLALALVALVAVALAWQHFESKNHELEKPSEDLVDSSRYGDIEPAMLAAFIKAQSTLGDFLELAESPPPGTRGFALKVQVKQGDQREYLWVFPFTVEPEGFSGHLNDVPPSLPSFGEGEEVFFQRDDIVDWTYDDTRSKTMHGNFTGCVALAREAPEHAEQFQNLYGLNCDW